MAWLSWTSLRILSGIPRETMEEPALEEPAVVRPTNLRFGRVASLDMSGKDARTRKQFW